MQKKYLQRTTILFEESIKSKYTKELYKRQLKQFLKFINKRSTNELALISSKQLQIMLEDYLIELRTTINPNSIPIRFTGLKHFCIMNRKNINWDIIYKLFPEKQKRSGSKPWTTPDIRIMLKNNSSVRTKALIHFLASTGARIGVLDHELQFKHTRKMKGGFMAIKLYAGYMDEYWSFLTPQAVKSLVEYCDYRIKRGEIISNHSPLFVSYDLKKPITLRAVKNITFQLLHKSNLQRNLEGTRYDVQMHHGFRKRFNTILKLNNSINYNIAEKLLGHKNGLDGVYFVPTIDELFLEYQKAKDDLKI